MFCATWTLLVVMATCLVPSGTGLETSQLKRLLGMKDESLERLGPHTVRRVSALRQKLGERLKELRPTTPHLTTKLAALPPPTDSTTTTESPADPSRNPRFFSLFSLVKFQNLACNGSAGSNGTCYSNKECKYFGGTSNGLCALGFGVCCVFTKSCGESSSYNDTYFVNPGSPGSYDGTGSCQYTALKGKLDICQFRLDFDQFTLSQPAIVDQTCQDDQFIVASGNPVPVICGQNTGSHMYIDVGSNSNSCTLTVVTSGSTFKRSWKIKVSQILCGALNAATPGCLQYYAGLSGQVTTFNYDPVNGRHLSNQDYSICIKMMQGFCGIKYQACATPMTTDPNANQQNMAMAFSVSTQNGADRSSGANTQNCMADWITIPCATDVTNSVKQSDGSICQDRLCGNIFHSINGKSTTAPVYSYRKPFILTVRFNNNEEGSDLSRNNRGFCLDYTLQPCTAGLM